MKTNIFEGAKFGDRFLTRNGQLTIFVRRAYNDRLEFIYQPNGTVYSSLTTTSDGHWFDDEENDLDVVTKYIEPIDEEILDDLALSTYPVDNEFNFELSAHMDGWQDKNEGIRKAFKAGYRKAKSE